MCEDTANPCAEGMHTLGGVVWNRGYVRSLSRRCFTEPWTSVNGGLMAPILEEGLMLPGIMILAIHGK